MLEEEGLAFAGSSVGVPYYVCGVWWDVVEELDEDGGFEVDLAKFRYIEPFEV